MTFDRSIFWTGRMSSGHRQDWIITGGVEDQTNCSLLLTLLARGVCVSNWQLGRMPTTTTLYHLVSVDDSEAYKNVNRISIFSYLAS